MTLRRAHVCHHPGKPLRRQSNPLQIAGRALQLRPDWKEVDLIKAGDPKEVAAAEHWRAAREVASRPSRWVLEG